MRHRVTLTETIMLVAAMQKVASSNYPAAVQLKILLSWIVADIHGLPHAWRDEGLVLPAIALPCYMVFA